MSKFDIQDNSWNDVIFENRNQKYGAYKLRKENDKTTIGALLFSTLFLCGAFALLSFTTPEPKKPEPEKVKPKPDVFTLVRISPKPKDKVEPTKGQKDTKKNLVKPANVAPVIVKDPIVKTPDEPKKPIDNTPYNPKGSDDGKLPGTEGKPNGDPKIPAQPENPEETGGGGSENGIYIPGVEAKYPGGIDKFREFIADKYTIPNDFDASILKITVYFVVEIDGSMTDIKMLKGDKALEKEAIRVLKSMRKKWTPGYVNGKAVRSEYVVPIQILLQNQEE